MCRHHIAPSAGLELRLEEVFQDNCQEAAGEAGVTEARGGFFKSRGAVKGARCFLDSKSGEGLQTVPRGLEATAETVWRDLPGFARSEGKEMELVHGVMFRFNTVILQR